jgi:hypothetical protein
MTDEFNDEHTVTGGLLHEMRGSVEALGHLKLFAQSAGGESTMPQIAALVEDTITRLNGRCEVLARDVPSLAASPEHRQYHEATKDALAVVRPYGKPVRGIGRFETFVADLDRIVTSLTLAHQVLTGFVRAKPLSNRREA